MSRNNESPAAVQAAWSQSDSTDTSIACAHDTLAFWESVGPRGWFEKNDDVDRLFRERCLDRHFAAARRQCEHWMDDAQAGLALIVLLDQFPRNVFRGTAHMFATDSLARHYARRYIDSGLIGQVAAELRLLACLPFVHSESIGDQDYAIALYGRHAPDNLDWAKHHRSIIERFGRFPHRNYVLGRDTTPDEQAFLDAGGFTG